MKTTHTTKGGRAGGGGMIKEASGRDTVGTMHQNGAMHPALKGSTGNIDHTLKGGKAVTKGGPSG
jgi:hypothetical protein